MTDHMTDADRKSLDSEFTNFQKWRTSRGLSWQTIDQFEIFMKELLAGLLSQSPRSRHEIASVERTLELIAKRQKERAEIRAEIEAEDNFESEDLYRNVKARALQLGFDMEDMHPYDDDVALFDGDGIAYRGTFDEVQSFLKSRMQ